MSNSYLRTKCKFLFGEYNHPVFFFQKGCQAVRKPLYKGMQPFSKVVRS